MPQKKDLHWVEPQILSHFIQQATHGSMESEHEEDWMTSDDSEKGYEAEDAAAKAKAPESTRGIVARRLSE